MLFFDPAGDLNNMNMLFKRGFHKKFSLIFCNSLKIILNGRIILQLPVSLFEYGTPFA